MPTRQVYIETYGCQMNEADSELLGRILLDGGYALTDGPEQADIILLNTCAVRERAEERIFGRVGELAQFKYERPEVLIGVLGCMAQHLRENLLQRSRFVDLVAGPDSYRRLPDMLAQAVQGRTMDVRLDRSELYSGIQALRPAGVTAWLTVQRGCDKCCAFCVVPAVRGRERCVPIPDVLREAQELVNGGVREITLLGQTVNSYTDGEHDFADLLKALAGIPELLRIRFTSPYPTHSTDKLIQTMAAEEKIARHVHLPLQSASNAILQRSRRRYTLEEYDEIVLKLRAAMPSIALSTDIIAGFCGETEEDHAKTCDYLRHTRFEFAFMFRYSRRSRTTAWNWPDDVDDQTKRRRLEEIINIQETISQEIQKALVGTTAKILVEGPSAKIDGQMFGRTPEFRQVVFPGPEAQPGQIVNVRITSATGHTLAGERTDALG